MIVDDPKLDEDEAGEIVDPARAVPKDGANCRNIVSGSPSRDRLGDVGMPNGSSAWAYLVQST